MAMQKFPAYPVILLFLLTNRIFLEMIIDKALCKIYNPIVNFNQWRENI